eukprot:TRINITY_DN7715_c0_g1_i1.p1 TRINITY_DN7715_c0_g1~~TRINITY_DN7715_c0_g1_i1.p1  ORF type:complete len:233 (-),score=40.45 TRINITY_DN7715_c0_g1_i1:231-929(-)
MMLLYIGTTFLVSCLSLANAQFGEGNANAFVDEILEDVKKTGDDEIKLENEKFVLIIDLLLISPQLELEVRNGVFRGLSSLSRSSDAIVTYDESAGKPVFTIKNSMLLSNVKMRANAQGKVKGFGFGLTMPNIVLNVTIDGVDVASVIDIDISDLSALKPSVKSVEFKDVGHIDVQVTGLGNEGDALASPISTLVVNTTKRDLQNLVQPMIKDTLQKVIEKNIPNDITQIFG